MKPCHALIAMLLVVAPLSPSLAHEGHRENMSDEEMAEMVQGEEHGEAVMPDAEKDEHAGEMHSAVAPTAGAALKAASESNEVRSLGDLLGRIHPIFVHFPIALFLVAGLAELALLASPGAGLDPVIRFLVYTGSAGGVLAALLGWFAGGWRLSDRSETLALHRWNGTFIAVLGIAAAFATVRTAPGQRGLRRAILAVLAVALLFQGYLGGEMTMGPNHLGIF